MLKGFVHKAGYAILGIMVFMILWEIGARVAPELVPHVREVANAGKQLAFNPDTQLDFRETLARTVSAFLIAIAFGLPLGLMIGSVRPFRLMFSGPTDFLRSIPAFVLLPLFLVVFKSGDTSRIAMAAFGAGLVIIANTAFGAAHVRRSRIEVARVYGAGPVFILFHVVARELLPQVLDGIRLAISLSLVLTIVGEIMLGATHGLGTRINDTLSGFDLPRMYALIGLVGVMGYLLNLIGRVVSQRLADYGKHL